jgi:hypothetical protein
LKYKKHKASSNDEENITDTIINSNKHVI